VQPTPTPEPGVPGEGDDQPEHDGSEHRGRLAAVIVYFRTPTQLSACLDSLRAQTTPPDEVLVVDNSSAIDGVDSRPSAGTDWEWIRAESNLGYGAAANLGARIAGADYLLLMNGDVVLGPDAGERLLAMAESYRRAGVVGPRIYGADDRIELSARAFPSLATGMLGRSSLLTKALVALKRTPPSVAPALGPGGAVDWVSGACMLIRRRAFEQVGGFDEGYWMYWEDADICRRLSDLGWETMLCTDAQARHQTGSSGRSGQTIEAFHASAARYYEAHLAKTGIGRRLARAALGARMRLMLCHNGRRA
jgi:N-acetylglucosaminyl-diphospho-decaprenol L-rhamnosyltransferase